MPICNPAKQAIKDRTGPDRMNPHNEHGRARRGGYLYKIENRGQVEPPRLQRHKIAGIVNAEHDDDRVVAGESERFEFF
jgi:hypothetical protein